jgi:ribosomal protein S18 acetylase RimI-like enzyme
MAVRVEAIADRHDLSTFECGKDELDQWLRHAAANAESMRTARTFLGIQDEVGVVAYFSLAATSVQRLHMPKRLGRGSPNQIPGILLARLAVHLEFQGRGLGGAMLVEALRRAVAAGESAGVRLMVVDAIDEDAATFYMKYGFARMPETNRLYRKLSDIATSLST